MRSKRISRRAFALGLTAAPLGCGAALRAAADARPADDDGLAHGAAAIHQEVSFAATPARVYRALTRTADFDAVTRLSDGAQRLAAPGAQPTAIGTGPGAEFTLFGGYITGRHLELAPGVRLVQAWRAGSWGAGEYSVVRFALEGAGAGTLLVFDHRGFPDAQGPSLAHGWRVHYWEPLAMFLAQR
jgi:activator of HSP90 ATPase